MTWTRVPIGECCEVVSGATPKTEVAEYWDGELAWATPADLSRLATSTISDTGRRITATGLASCSARVLPAGSVLFSSRAPIGHVAINTVPMATNQGFKSLIPKPGLADAGYLAHWLRANKAYLQSLGSGATFKEVSKAVVARVKVPLPPHPEQRRIAAILDHTDALRAKRRHTLTLLDTLKRSAFEEAFGDPHGGRWDMLPLGDVVGTIDSGTSPNCETRAAADGEWGVLKLGAVTYGEFREGENKAYLGSLGSMTANEVRPGDVLMTRKNTRELVGAVAFVDDAAPRLLLPDLIFRLHLDQARLDPRYFQAMMMAPRTRSAVRDLSSGSAASMPNISKARLRTLRIGVPPLDLQREFASRVAEINTQRAVAQRSLDSLDELFASLQSRAFSGEL